MKPYFLQLLEWPMFMYDIYATCTCLRKYIYTLSVLKYMYMYIQYLSQLCHTLVTSFNQNIDSQTQEQLYYYNQILVLWVLSVC